MHNFRARCLTAIFTFITLTGAAYANAPSNDNIADAQTITLTGDSVTIHSTNSEATREAGEPFHSNGGEIGEKSVWYKWTATENVSMQVQLIENFHSSFSIYRSTQPSATFATLTKLNGTNDANGYQGTKYQAIFVAQAGTTYYIAIDSGILLPLDGIFDLTLRRNHLRYGVDFNSTNERYSIAVFRPSEGRWYGLYDTRNDGSVLTNLVSRVWGQSGDTLVPADYTGYGFTVHAVARNVDGQKVWMFEHPYGIISQYLTWGLASDAALVGDFDRDGAADQVALRQTASGLSWYVRRSRTNSLLSFQFGLNSDQPVMGDFDGDGATEVAVTRIVGGQMVWHFIKSGFEDDANNYSQYYAVQFGQAGDQIATGDYDGDRKTDIAVFRPSNGNWYILRSGDGQLQIINFGIATDVPQPGDYDGDDKTDVGVYRAAEGNWYQLLSGNNAVKIVNWGLPTDIPVAAFNSLAH